MLWAAAGAKLLSYYFTLGDYDFLIVAEGDTDLTSFVGALIAVVAGGGVTDLKSTVAITSAEAKKAFQKAGALAGSFRTAGQH